MLDTNTKAPQRAAPAKNKKPPSLDNANPAPIVVPKIKAAVSPLDMIDASIGPMGAEPDLMAEVRRLHAANSVFGMLNLFRTYRDMAEAFLHRQNTASRHGVEILEDEFAHQWSKAYIVAEHLKTMRPSEIERDQVAEALFQCALMMGHELAGAVSVAQAVAVMPGAEVDSISGNHDPQKAVR